MANAPTRSALIVFCVFPVFLTISHASRDDCSSSDSPYAGRPWVLPYHSTQDDRLRQNLQDAEMYLSILDTIGSRIKHLVDRAADISLEEARKERLIEHLVPMNKYYWKGFALLFDAATYSSERLSADGTDQEAQAFKAEVGSILVPFMQAYLPAAIILKLCKESVFEEFVNADDSAKEAEFYLRETRKMKPHTLSLPEENVITAFSAPGYSAWNTLWAETSTAVKLSVTLEDEETEMGLSAIAVYNANPDPGIRKKAWIAERDGWLSLDIPLATALNSITSWRSTNDKLRNQNCLTETLASARMGLPSHDAMFKMIRKQALSNSRALLIHAETWEKSVLDPWDIWASSPLETEEDLVPYDEAIDLIAEAVGAYIPKAGEFVRRMRDDELIDGGIRDTKKFGSHCAFFPVDGVPVVYMDSYNGSRVKLNTLAHELGHAYHVEVMKELPFSQMMFGLNIAETASLFFEAIMDDWSLIDAAGKKAEAPEASVSAHYRTTKRVVEYLLHRPTRFEFELKMHDQDGKISTTVVNDLMVEAWRDYYGDRVNNLDHMGYFAYKTLHYYKTDTPFYNWQYTFGYLLAEKLFAKCKMNKDYCHQIYNDFFMDSGIMTSEELVQKHMEYDISQDTIWEEVAEEVELKIRHFEEEWASFQAGKKKSAGTTKGTKSQSTKQRPNRTSTSCGEGANVFKCT